MDSNGSSAVAAAVDLTGSSAVAESQRRQPPTDRVFAEKRIAWEEINEECHNYSARVNRHTGYCRWQGFACEGAHSSSYNACGCAGAHTNYRSPCSGRQSGACRRWYIRGTGAHHYGSNGISASTKETAGLVKVHQSRRHDLVECGRPDSCHRPHHCFLSH